MRRALLIICYLFVCITANAEVNIPEIYKDKAGNSIRLKKVDSSAGIDLYVDKDKGISIQIIDLNAGAIIEPHVNKLKDVDYGNAAKERKEFQHLTINKTYYDNLKESNKNLYSVFNTVLFSSYKKGTFDCNPIFGADCADNTKLNSSIMINGKYYKGLPLKDEEGNVLTEMVLTIDKKNKTVEIFELTNFQLSIDDDLKTHIGKLSSSIPGSYLDLNPDSWKKDKGGDSRTAIGVIDQDGDKKGDTIIALLAHDLKIIDVAEIFKEFKVMGVDVDNDGKCSDEFCKKMQIMSFDSGSSTQFYSQQASLESQVAIGFSRPVPAVMLVHSADIEDYCKDHSSVLVPFRKNNKNIEIHEWKKLKIQNCKTKTSSDESAVILFNDKYFFVGSRPWEKYINTDGANKLGNPIMNSVPILNGHCQSFEKGMITWFDSDPLKASIDYNTQLTCANYMTTDDCFADVNSATEYMADICKLKTDGVIDGFFTDYPKASFSPNNKILRQEVFKPILLLKYGKEKIAEFSSSKPKFSDVKTTDWVNKYANFALSKGIISNNRLLRPGDGLTLSEAAKIILNTLEIEVRNRDPGEDWEVPYIEKLKSIGVEIDDFESINRGYFAHILATVNKYKTNGGK